MYLDSERIEGTSSPQTLGVCHLPASSTSYHPISHKDEEYKGQDMIVQMKDIAPQEDYKFRKF